MHSVVNSPASPLAAASSLTSVTVILYPQSLLDESDVKPIQNFPSGTTTVCGAGADVPDHLKNSSTLPSLR